MTPRLALQAGCILLAATACGSPAASPLTDQPATQVASIPPSPPAGPADVPAAVQLPESPRYETRGRRDPFETLETREGASGPLVASAKLTGIVRGTDGPLALVETGDGLGYILKPGDTLGDGRLMEIGHDSVVFTVQPKPGATTNRVVLRLPGD